MKDVTFNNYLPEGYKFIYNKEDLVDSVPIFWVRILESSDANTTKEIIIDVWNSCFINGEMSKTIQLMKNFLKDVYLVSSENGISIIYLFEVNETTYFREGRNPFIKNSTKEVDVLFKLAPTALLNFYKDVHNGWFELETEAMGLFPIENITLLGEDDWGILDEIEVDFDLNKVLTLFSNGGGGYLCMDFNSNPPNGLIWWSDETPDINLSFFDVIDEWVCLGFE